MRVLVVGGAGYVGGALTDLLADGPHQVRVYDSLLYEESYRKPVDFAFGDVRDERALLPHLKWADAVVWLAAIVGDGACAADPQLTTRVNEQVINWLVRNFDRRIVFTSTCSVYGAHIDLLTEASPVNPLSLYAKTKLNAEAHLTGAPAMVLRLGTLFGVGDTYARIRMDLVVNTLTARAYHYRRISVFGGNQYRPLLHVRDAAYALASCLDVPHTGVFNVASTNIRIADLADKLRDYYPDLVVNRTEEKFEDNRNYKVSVAKFESCMPPLPGITVEQGIGEVHALLSQGRVKKIGIPRYSNNNFLRNLTDRPATPHGYELAHRV